jgi:hypothetical protein
MSPVPTEYPTKPFLLANLFTSFWIPCTKTPMDHSMILSFISTCSRASMHFSSCVVPAQSANKHEVRKFLAMHTGGEESTQ